MVHDVEDDSAPSVGPRTYQEVLAISQPLAAPLAALGHGAAADGGEGTRNPLRKNLGEAGQGQIRFAEVPLAQPELEGLGASSPWARLGFPGEELWSSPLSLSSRNTPPAMEELRA